MTVLMSPIFIIFQKVCRKLMCHEPNVLEESSKTCKSVIANQASNFLKFAYKLDLSGSYPLECGWECCGRDLHGDLRHKLYVPVRDALNGAPGFRSQIAQHAIHVRTKPISPFDVLAMGKYGPEAVFAIGLFKALLSGNDVQNTKIVDTILSLTIPVNLSETVQRTITLEGWDYEYISQYTGDDGLQMYDPADGTKLFACRYGRQNGWDSIQSEHPPVVETAPLFFSRIIACPYVQVNISEYNVKIEGSDLCFVVNGNEFCLTSIHYRLQNGSYLVCYDKYQEITSFALSALNPPLPLPIIQIEDPSSSDRQFVFDSVCSLVAVIPHAISVVTYSSVPTLRSVDGANILSFSVSLFLASGLTVANVLVSLEGTVCVVVGALIHWFWLLSFVWMFIGCVHMFLTSAAIKHHFGKGSWRQYLIYLSIAIGFAAVFVLVNILSRLLPKDVLDYGYDNRTCYISTGDNAGYSVVLPLSLVILTNLSLFMFSLAKSRRLSKENDGKIPELRLMLVWVKLSLLAGITWLFGFIYHLTDDSLFSSLFFMSGAVLGLYSMLVFVLNARVWHLFRAGMRNKKLKLDQVYCKDVSIISDGEKK